MPRSASVLVAGLVTTAAILSGCSDGSRPSDATATSSTPASAASPTVSAEVAAARCQESSPRGPVDHTLEGFAFESGSATVSVTAPGQDARCYSYPRWGNADPAVPVDSLLFLFKGPGTDGVTIDMAVGDLTQRTKVVAKVAVSTGGTTYQGEGCSMDLTALSSAGVAGSFTCPTATEVFGNPLAPLDDAETEPSTSTPLPTASITGWFAVEP